MLLWLKSWKPLHLCWLFRKFGLPIPPLFIGNQAEEVTTNDATLIGKTTATLNGTLVQGAGPFSGDCWFQWGETTAYGNTTESAVVEDGQPFSQQITDLTPGTVYHFRAGTGNKTAYGVDKTFRTLSERAGNPNIDQAIYQHIERKDY